MKVPVILNRDFSKLIEEGKTPEKLEGVLITPPWKDWMGEDDSKQ